MVDGDIIRRFTGGGGNDYSVLEQATNYPLIRMTDKQGNIVYARTFNWSSTGVATGKTPQSVQFTLPAGRKFSPG